MSFKAAYIQNTVIKGYIQAPQDRDQTVTLLRPRNEDGREAMAKESIRIHITKQARRLT